MEISIRGTPQEIAALVLAVQRQQTVDLNGVTDLISDCLVEAFEHI